MSPRASGVSNGCGRVEEYKLTLRKLAVRDDRFIDALLSEEHANATLAGIDPRSHALVRIAALIALDAAPPSYMSAVEPDSRRAHPTTRSSGR